MDNQPSTSSEFKIRHPFNPKYSWHRAKSRPCSYYRLYNSEGKRKTATKYFSAQFDFESQESLAEYELWLKEMGAYHTAGVGVHTVEYTIGELKTAWLQFRKRQYRNEKQESAHDRKIAAILTPYDNLNANDFRSSLLILMRDKVQEEAEELDHRNRRTINNYIRDCIKIFSWGSVRDFVKKEVIADLNEIKPLSHRESPKLRDSKIVDAANGADVEAAIKAATPTIATMLIVQWETGGRPKEVRPPRRTGLECSRVVNSRNNRVPCTG
jgi:hypothetical protein